MKRKILGLLSVLMFVILGGFVQQAEARIYINIGSNCGGYRSDHSRGHYRPPVHCHPDYYRPPCRPRYVAPPCYRPPVRIYRPAYSYNRSRARNCR